jgi:hypothetical protein
VEHSHVVYELNITSLELKLKLVLLGCEVDCIERFRLSLRHSRDIGVVF